MVANTTKWLAFSSKPGDLCCYVPAQAVGFHRILGEGQGDARQWARLKALKSFDKFEIVCGHRLRQFPISVVFLEAHRVRFRPYFIAKICANALRWASFDFARIASSRGMKCGMIHCPNLQSVGNAVASASNPQIDLTCRYSSSPKAPIDRPMPDCL